jgi:hypothetical protein
MLRSGGTTRSTERVLPPDLGAAMHPAIKTHVRVDSTSHHAARIHGSGLLDAQRQQPMLVKLFSGVMSWSLLLAQRFHMRENIMCTPSLRTARPLHEKSSIEFVCARRTGGILRYFMERARSACESGTGVCAAWLRWL